MDRAYHGSKMTKKYKQNLPTPMDLTAKQRKFCEEYVSGKNPTQAAVAAFNSPTYDSAKSIAYQLMHKTGVPRYIQLLWDKSKIHEKVVEAHAQLLSPATDAHVRMRAVAEGYKALGMYPKKEVTVTHKSKVSPEFEGWLEEATLDELHFFKERGKIPTPEELENWIKEHTIPAEILPEAESTNWVDQLKTRGE
ncbi:terminase small subunit [Acidobacteria bacterium AH-259-L09]|nr:terminase small subunit [Acidobacteria bacterium AH-259-L09]